MDFQKKAEDFFANMNPPRKGLFPSENMRGEVFILHYLFSNGHAPTLTSAKNLHSKIVPVSVGPGDISREMGISSARVATALNNLESKGLLTRQIDIRDRRKILIELTDKGGEQAKNNKDMFIGQVAKMFEFLGEADADEYIRITKRLAGMQMQNDKAKISFKLQNEFKGEKEICYS